MKDTEHLTDDETVNAYTFDFLEKLVKAIFELINQSSEVDDARGYFQLLDIIQFWLAKVVFKDKKQVNQFLRDFISQFDRLDDEDWIKELYRRIKNNE